MTRQEAIELLKLDRDMANFNPITGEKMPMNEYNAKSVEALDMAIKALEQEPEIIRCRNCRHDNDCEIQYSAQEGSEFFCGLAERRAEE